MRTALRYVSRLMNPSWMTGPIFAKELRVASRRKRNYLLRFLYVLLLTVFIVIVWCSAVERAGPGQTSASYHTSRMSAAGIAIVSTIVIFQFLASQLVAVIMLSTTISDEIYDKTLGVLMTTPINSFQIVSGKLLSRLLQVVLLITTSLPLLAVVRVFGGVPWGYIFSMFCVTLTAVVFAGSLSMYFSISARRAYAVILKTIFVLAVLYAFAPFILAYFLVEVIGIGTGPLMFVMMLANPFFAIRGGTAVVFGGGGGMRIGGMPFIWPIHCGIMLMASAVILARCMVIVRRVALRQATGGTEIFSRRIRSKRRVRKSTARLSRQSAGSGGIRRVRGYPVVWKELRTPLVRGGRTQGLIALAAAIIALVVTYGICAKGRCLDESFCHVTYTVLFMILGLIATVVLSATNITTEKESRSWPLLLTTIMDDWQILAGKALGIFRRCLPIWCLLAGHILLFVIVGYIHPIAIIHLIVIVGCLIVFITGSGLYFSVLLRRSTSAVIAILAFTIGIWVITPMLLGLMEPAMEGEGPFLLCMSTNPVVQAGIVVAGASGQSNATAPLGHLEYSWPVEDLVGTAGETTIMVVITMAAYALCGLLFAWRAKLRLRKKIF